MGVFVPAYAAGTRAADFAWWCDRYLVQSVDRFAGLPLTLEDWQLGFFSDALAVDEAGDPYWQLVCLVLPRKNSKTTMLAAYSLYHLLEDGGSPEILLTASSDKQAGRLFESCVSFIRRHRELEGALHRREYIGEIARVDGMGKILRMSSDPGRAHGYNPSLVVADELHAWGTPSLRRAWGAFTTGGGARSASQVFAITTAGEAQDRAQSILGRLVDSNEARGEVERPHDALTVSRNHEGRVLVFNYQAPTVSRDDVQALLRANPASWITEGYLRRQVESPGLTDAEVLQLHGCVWAEGVNAWLPAERWAACAEPGLEIPEGARVMVGVDVALKHDTSAVAVAWREGELTRVQATVWAADERAQAHALMPGGRIDLEVIEDHIRHLCRRFRVLEVAFDPRFFERSAQILAGEGVPMVEMVQSSQPMADAYQCWYQAVLDGRVRHPGDPVLDAHVLGVAAQQTDRGWKVSKIRQSQHIDACVAAAIAVYRAEAADRNVPWVGSW